MLLGLAPSVEVNYAIAYISNPLKRLSRKSSLWLFFKATASHAKVSYRSVPFFRTSKVEVFRSLQKKMRQFKFRK